MKRWFTKISVFLIVAAIYAGSYTAGAVEVTFRVDMSEQTVSANGVHIAGSFQGWNPGSTQLTKAPFGNVYSVTLTFNPGDYLEFKYVNGNAWGQDESVPVGCASNGNRFYTVPAENVVIPVVCFGKCAACVAPLVDVTFQVDMSNEDVSPNGVHIAGSFQNWDPSGTPLLPVGEGVYAVTIPLTSGEYYEYKFVNGNDWGFDETVPPACASGWNRFLTAPEISTVLEAVCYGSCDPCPSSVVDVNVTFRIDMSQQDISPQGVHIAGGFQGWNPGSTLMVDEGNGIYSFTAVLPSDSYQEYKFVNGTTWDESEDVPEECGVNNNRFLTVPDEDIVLDLVCYGMCEECPLPAEVEITFRVDMSLEDISPDGVHIAGTFNEFSTSATPMTPQRDGIYEATVTLTEGDYIMYKFVNGNTFAGFETVPAECSQEDGNRYLTVPGDTTALDAVCFASCEPCVPPSTVMVTFQVDMSNEEVSAEGVYVAGSFQGWNASGTPLTDMGSGVWAATVEVISGETYLYKYLNGPDFLFTESVPSACGEPDGFGGFNRMVEVPETNYEIPLHCFSSCLPCVAPSEVDVTFSVDMSNEVVNNDSVFVAGNFNGFDPTATPMTPAGDGVYTATVTLTAGETALYKFLNSASFDGAETVPAECGQDDGFGGFNRFFTVPEENMTLDVVCFGMCGACPLPETVEVTFQVDMSNEDVSAEGVHIAGGFQGWAPDSTMMTETVDNIWVYTAELNIGQAIEYKFVNGITWDDAEQVPGECSQNGNRFLTVPAEDVVLDLVCFGTCAECVVPVLVDVTFSVDMSNEVVNNDSVFLAGNFNGYDPTATPMTPAGDGVYTATVTLTAGETALYKFLNSASFDGAETVPAECGQDDGFGGFNRFFTVPEENMTLDVVCFGMCGACPLPETVEVTFRVDMSNEDVSAEGVHIAGSFQGWAPDSTMMTETVDNIWVYTAELNTGQAIEYKFVNGITWDDAEQVPGECSQNGNRFLTVPGEDVVLDLVCFGTCAECVLPVLVDVTFSVDMSNEIISQNGVFMAGSFNGFSPDATQMMDVGGGVYSATINLVAGEFVIYKILNGPSFDFVEFVPAECGQDDGFGGFNRYLTVPEIDSILPVVCFSSCYICERTHTIQLFEGWNGLSSYRLPDGPDIIELMSQIQDELIILQTMTAAYYPDGQINNINNWESQSAYKIKVTEDVTLTITGMIEQNKTIQLNQGWTLISVLSDQPVSVAALFAGNPELVVVKGIAETGIYWPLYDINTLINLMPGKSYFVKMNEAGEITFP
jgi:1,4-alpha-glucan branching enzyme